MNGEIKCVDQLLRQCISPNKEVKCINVSRLTAPGENYLSLVLKVEAALLDGETGKEELFSGVAKCRHRDDGEDASQFERDSDKYLSELVFYTEIVPTLQKFAKENGLKRDMDIFPKLIAYRPNLHGKNEEIDGDSVLLLENMTVNGFTNIDRHVGFNYETVLLILRDLALFHALPVALKLKMPHIFETKIRKHVRNRSPFGSPPEPQEGEELEPPPEMGHSFRVYCELLEEHDQCKSYVNKLERNGNYWKLSSMGHDKPKSEPFATICHNDTWINNTMQIVRGGTVVKNKFIDFQSYNYNSPAHDLLFFIGSSVQLPVIKEHFEDFLEYYYGNFIEILEELDCETRAFSRHKFEDELKTAAFLQLHHTVLMNKFMFCEKGQEISQPFFIRKEDVTDYMQERIAYLIFIFGKRGWI